MLRTVVTGCLFIFLPIITILIPPIQGSVSRAGPEVFWQSSQAPVIELGVRNKTGSLDKFTAVWTVREPDGTLHKATATVERDDSGDVRYPDDFNTYSRPGRYSWKCLVDGREVATGSFEFRTVATYSDQLTVHR